MTTANAIARLDVNGTVDPTLTSPAPFYFPFITQVFAEPDGQILVAGHTFPQFFGGPGGGTMEYGLLLQLNGDGSTAGSVVNFGNYQIPQIVGVQSNGEILYFTSGQSGISRLTPSLGGDHSFGPTSTSGFVPAGQTLSLSAGAIGPDGSIIGVGALSASNPTSSADAAVRLTKTFTKATLGDYTGDGIADPAFFLSGTAYFVIGSSSPASASQVVQLGAPGPGNTIPAPGDYYTTGQQDVAVYIAQTGYWAIKDPTGQTPGVLFPFGVPGVGNTIPVPGNYAGFGTDQAAVYLAQSGTWDILDPGFKPGITFPFGQPGVGNTIPVSGDYFGVGIDQVAVFLPQSATWSILSPGLSSDITFQFGIPGAGNSIPMPGDYDGSGRTEPAVYLPALGEVQYITPTNQVVTIPFGVPGNGQTLPAPGDYDGSGKTEVAAYFPSSNFFVYRPADGGADKGFQVGFASQGPIVPVTTVVPTALLGGSVSAEAVGPAGPLGQADALDFVMPLASAKKAKPGDPQAT